MYPSNPITKNERLRHLAAEARPMEERQGYKHKHKHKYIYIQYYYKYMYILILVPIPI